MNLYRGLLFITQGYLEDSSLRVLILNWRVSSMIDCSASVSYQNTERGTPCYVRVVATSGMPAGVLAQTVDLRYAQPIPQHHQLPSPVRHRGAAYRRVKLLLPASSLATDR